MDAPDDLRGEEIAVQDTVSEDYEAIRYAKVYSVKYQAAWFQDMVSLITRRGLVLDNGCGIGYLAEFMPADDIVGIDLSAGMLTRARGRLNKIVRGESQGLPFKDETFDIVFCRALLHHLPDPDRGIAEMSRVLKKGGEIIVSEPIKSVLSGLPRKMVKGGARFSCLHKDFSDTELMAMLREEFTITDTRYFGYLAYPLLGFPDVIDPLKYLPLKKGIASFFICLDRLISKIPAIKKQSWGVTVRAIK